MQHLFGAHIDSTSGESIQSTSRRWRNTSSVGEMLDELQWSTLEVQRDQSSLIFFHKINCATMSIDKDKHLTRLKEQDLPGNHVTHSILGHRLKVMP